MIPAGRDRVSGAEDCGASNIAGTTSETGLVRTYTFSVPGSVQAVGSETPVNFTIVATDSGAAYPRQGCRHWSAENRWEAASCERVTVTNGIAGPGGIPWVKSQPGFVDVVAGCSEEAAAASTCRKLKPFSGGVQFESAVDRSAESCRTCTFGTTTGMSLSMCRRTSRAALK